MPQSPRANPKLRELRDFCRLAGLEGCGGKRKQELLLVVNRHLRKYRFAPRYLRGLSTEDKFNKKFEIKYSQLLEKNRGEKKYSKTRTDLKYERKNSKKNSKYTKKWNSKYRSKSMTEKSSISGVPLNILKKVYNRGLSAWRGGSHRPGASQQSWATARVNSFLLCGKTWQFPDHLLATEAMNRSPKARKFWRSCNKKLLGKKSSGR